MTLIEMNPKARPVLYGQDINPRSYAMCKSDMIIGEVIALMVDVLFDAEDEALTKPGTVRTIYDPAAGTGGMLSTAYDHPDIEVDCPHCGMRQEVGGDLKWFECWQCEQASDVPPPPKPSR